MKILKKTAFLLLALSLLPGLTGCWYAAAAGAGAYGGYKAKEAGYSLQSPVTKKDKSKKPPPAETTKQTTTKQ
ncbi:MAG TPA: hypothetical protein PK175_09815 [Syntrophales bacterium]|jgi:hypothetical protein|nr:hypothetical protein [Syntrophales bacterium]HON23991.1 hypothetical protein [Syntrophales bacterium]HOU78186.1 hypothetical protein [Syntrophales bacterium]HPC33277.1 hypothetical protein [Syntrophales bacterium]HQG35156.1 hypothetical protein [Syntrophales bacterium]